MNQAIMVSPETLQEPSSAMCSCLHVVGPLMCMVLLPTLQNPACHIHTGRDFMLLIAQADQHSNVSVTPCALAQQNRHACHQ